MKTKLFFFALICILMCTLLVSCNNLVQPDVREFSLTIDAATAEKIAGRASVSGARASSIPDTDTRTVTIAIKLTSVTPGVFLCTDSTSTTMNRLVGTTLTINNVPLNTALNVSLEFFVDNVKVYTAGTDSPFTLTDENTYNLSLQLREVTPNTGSNMPYVVWKDVEATDSEGEPYIGRQYYRMANANAEPVAVFPEWNLPYPDMSLQYCFDSDGNLWFLSNSMLNVFPAGESSVNKLIYASMSQNFPTMTTLAYDASTDKLILIGYTEEDGEPDFTLLSTDPDKLLKDAVDMPEDFTETQTESFTASFTDYLENILFPLWEEAPIVEDQGFAYHSKVYAYNGTLYCIEDYGDDFYLSWYCIETGNYDYKGLPCATNSEFAYPEDYSLDWVYATDEMADKDCNDYLLKAWDSENQYYDDRYVTDVVTHEYNDIAVIDDTVYVLFHEKVWSYYRDKWGDRSDDEGKFSEWLIDRGAILKFDAATLEYKGAIGLNEVKESVPVPANILVTDDSHYTKAYLDEGLTRPATLNMKMIWGLPCEETANADRVFSNPMSFVAVGPKKLVVADGGVFYYTDTDYLPPDQAHDDTTCFQIATRAKSRMVTVDLDYYTRSDFGTFTDDYFQTEQPEGSVYTSIHDRFLQEGETFYGKGFTAHFEDSYFTFDDFTNTTISYYNGLKFTGYNENNVQKTSDSLNLFLTGAVTFGEQE